MSAMVGFWAVCIFTARKNKLLKHGIGGLTMADYISREAVLADLSAAAEKGG